MGAPEESKTRLVWAAETWAVLGAPANGWEPARPWNVGQSQSMLPIGNQQKLLSYQKTDLANGLFAHVPGLLPNKLGGEVAPIGSGSKIYPAGIGPQVLVLGSIYQGSILGLPYFGPTGKWGKICSNLGLQLIWTLWFQCPILDQPAMSQSEHPNPH